MKSLDQIEVGLNANAANGCYGKRSGGNTYGIPTTFAINCYGEYDGNGTQAYAIYATQVAIGCYGNNTFTTRSILTTIANCCAGNLISATYKYNMP